MADINTVAVDLHVKRYSDFDLLRIAKAVSQDYEGLITAYLVNVHTNPSIALDRLGRLRWSPAAQDRIAPIAP